jgi:hypothetical protein
MSINKYEHLPNAGDFEHEGGTEVFYLAPRPLPTGSAAFSSRKLHKTSNEAYLDFALGVATLEFGVRCMTGSILCMAILISTFTLGLGLYEAINYGGSAFRIFLQFIEPNWYIWGFFSFLITVYGFSLSRVIYQLTKHPPIRFNRQRREVAYVPKRGQPPRFVPWEEVIACVTSGQVVTQYGTHSSFSLMIGLRDADSGEVLWLTVPTGALMLAVSEWESIRAYMEEGPSALPQPMSEEHEEGTVAFFYFCRRVYRENYSYPHYFFGFLMIQFFSGWTLPCHIAAWIERLPRTSFPKAVIEWSKPLPPEQWQKPSEDLIEQSKAVRQSLRKGKSLFDHFQSEIKSI